jgi:DNA-binding transcriptional ArsR family regulator
MTIVVDAYGNPTVAAKFEEEIGALMVKRAKAEGKHAGIPTEVRVFGAAHAGYRQSAKAKERHARAVLRYLSRRGPLNREALISGVKASGLDVSRDIVTHILLTYQKHGLVNDEMKSGKRYWRVEGDLEAFFEAENEKDQEQ